jgi:hypothetical protein
MAIPIGSSIFYFLSLVFICLLVLLLLRYYLPLRTTPAYLLVPVFLAVALPANLIILVPIDLASNPTKGNDPSGIWLPQRALLVAWRISYWLTFCLTWFILPILGEYVDSGDREPKDKLLYSLRSNGRYYAMVLSAASVGLVYFIISEGFHFTSLKGLVMALAYAWGLILAIYLMGHGLVAVPKRLIRDANIGHRLRRLQSQAPKAYEKLIDSSDDLQSFEQQVNQLRQRQSGTAKEFRGWIEELADMTSLPESRIIAGATLPTQTATIPHVITSRYLADLTRKLKRARHKQLRYESEWNGLLNSVVQTQAVLDAKPSRRLIFPNTKSLWMSPTARYYLHAQILPVLSYVAGGILALASASIIWSELTKQYIPGISVVKVSIIPTASQRVRFPSQVFAAFWLSYMSGCALYSITVLPLWGNRALVHRITYLESAAWYSGQVAKLTVPLAYNFLTFLPQDFRENTMFFNFLGKLIVLTPLGRGFDRFFPIILLFPVLAALFGFYGKAKEVFGFGELLTEDDAEDQWREGKLLIDRELRERGTNRASALGLSDSPSREGSLDINRRNGAAPLPSTARAGPSTRPARATNSERRPLVSALGDEADSGEGGNFFSDFAHRVRNTFDSVERPSWLPTVGGSDEEGGQSTNGPNNDWDWGRIFGGRANEGRVRL